MTDFKLYTNEELRKMSPKERNKVLLEMNKDLAQLQINLKMGKEKQSHKKTAYRKQKARILTLDHNPVQQ